VNGHDVERVEDVLLAHVLEEPWINRRHAAEGSGETRVFAGDRGGRQTDHFRERSPAFVELEVPVGQIVRLVPEHHRIDHVGG